MYIAEAGNMAPLREPIFYFNIGSSNMSRPLGHEKSPRDIHCFMLTIFDIDKVEMQRFIEKKCWE